MSDYRGAHFYTAVQLTMFPTAGSNGKLIPRGLPVPRASSIVQQSVCGGKMDLEYALPR